MTALLLLLAGAAAILFALFGKRIWAVLKAEWQTIVKQARADVHQRKWEANNPVGEPVSDEEAEDVVRWYRSLARPALLLTPAANPKADTGARLGGSPWFADGEHWPTDGNGQKLEFLAQIDFAQLPALDAFPDVGALRFFIGRDDIFGVNFDAPERGDFAILWHPGPAEGGRYEPPLALTADDGSPFQDETVRVAGKAFDAALASDLPDASSLEVQVRLDGQGRREGISELEDELFTIAEERPFGHRIGGHPTFTQSDFRMPGRNDEYDVVLLALTSDEWIMWGDVGEAVFMLRAADLAARDFSRVAFYWDCH